MYNEDNPLSLKSGKSKVSNLLLIISLRNFSH